MTDPRPLKGLYHFAYPARHAEDTRPFNEELRGQTLVNSML